MQFWSNTPKSFQILVKKLKANSKKPYRILALGEINDTENFHDYDTFPKYREELDNIQMLRARRESQHTLYSQDTAGLRADNGIQLTKCINDADMKDIDEPLVKIATWILQVPVKIGEKLSK